MNKKLTLNSQAILEKRFSKNVKGYDPDEVDDFLDVVMCDYIAYDSKLADMSNYIRELEEKNHLLQDAKQKLEIENARLSGRFSNIKPGTKLTDENIELMDKIGRYEKYLHSIGVNPEKLK